jgi:hypothetical protein
MEKNRKKLLLDEIMKLTSYRDDVLDYSIVNSIFEFLKIDF